MKCFVDAGNSRIKWRMGPKGDVHVCDWSQLDDLPDLLEASAAGSEPARIVLASVVEPARAEALGDHLEDVWPGVDRQWLKVRARSGDLTIGYAEPQQLGVDRFCAMLAVRDRYPGQAVVLANVGTAVTLDVLTADGRHRGGAIMPGYAAMLSGLAASAPVLIPATEAVRGAGLLPTPAAGGKSEFTQLLAQDTRAAISLGCHWMLASALQSALMALRAEMADAGDGQGRVVLSGGDAPRLGGLLQEGVGAIDIEPDLVLDGVVLLAKRQR